MDYVVGSIAALISGNVTPNRPKLIRRALTPTKHPISPNVTPKSEFVEDRSIFLSPTQQKKKAIIKKSPKRIFENPDLDITENNEGSSPKADKVKKHLKEELEADAMAKSKKSPSNKLDKSIQSDSPVNKSKVNDSQVSHENTPKKKKKKSEAQVSDNSKVEEMVVEETTTEIDKKDKKSPKKQKHKPSVDIVQSIDNQTEDVIKADETVQNTNNQEGKKKKNKKRKKNKNAKLETDTVQNNTEKVTAEDSKDTEENKNKSPNKKKNRKNKNKKAKLVSKESKTETTGEDSKTPQPEKDDLNVSKPDDNDDSDEETNITNAEDDDNESDEEISNIANPNAITEQDTDSEHESDDEIESENEEINKEALKTEDAADSSDDEEAKTKKGAKKNKKEAAQKPEGQEGTEENQLKVVNTEEEIKRTLFVGNVPFSSKCKKEIKKIFAEYGEIETVRIRTVPVKDGRVTPKLAVIRNELHPERSTVNVYVKFTNPDSVERALSANNTVLSNHHLRVSRSGSTGGEHDPRCAVFVGNLPFGMEDETLRDKFHKCGDIESVRIVRDKKTNAGKGFGYVNFTSKDGVELALGLSEEDLTVKNRIIRVKRCTHTLSKASKNPNKVKPGPKNFGNNQGPNRNLGNNQGPNRNFGNNQGPSRNFGNNQRPNRNFGNQNRSQGNRNFGNDRGPNRNFGNNQEQRSFNNQGPNRSFGNRGPNRNFGNQGPRSFGDQNKSGNQGNDASGASRRIMNKRPNQESGEGPPTKKQNVSQPPREKKQKKEFVGMTGEKKKKQKFNKDTKKKKVLSEILTKT